MKNEASKNTERLEGPHPKTEWVICAPDETGELVKLHPHCYDSLKDARAALCTFGDCAIIIRREYKDYRETID